MTSQDFPPSSATNVILSPSAFTVLLIFISTGFLSSWFTIHWPDDVESVCSHPAPPPASDLYPVHLGAVDRRAANRTFDQIAEAIAAYESSCEVNAFPSSTSSWRARQSLPSTRRPATHYSAVVKLIAMSATGMEDLARSHFSPTLQRAILGLPMNRAIPFYFETVRDEFGYALNPSGLQYIDTGVGRFLNKEPQLSGSLNSNEEWVGHPNPNRFKVPTLRNVDMRPRPDFVKAYMHNGYLKSLKEDSSLLQYASRIAALRATRSWRESQLLARARIPEDDKQKTTGQSGFERQTGGSIGGVLKNTFRWVPAARGSELFAHLS
jgi:hypothetical protein